MKNQRARSYYVARNEAGYTSDLLQAEQKNEADLVLYELEVLLDELPGAVEDWAHLLIEEGKICSEVRHLLHRDKNAAIQQLVDVFRRLCEVNLLAQQQEVPPEFVEEIGLGPTSARGSFWNAIKAASRILKVRPKIPAGKSPGRAASKAQSSVCYP